MLEHRYQVIYQGEIVDGHDPDEVMEKLTRLFSMDKKTAQKLFSPGRVIIKSNLDESQAAFYQTVMSKAGARVILERMDDDSDDSDVTGAEATAGAGAAPGPPADAGAGQNGGNVVETGSRAPVTKRKVFQFNGTGGEYFKIWIVNLLLSIVTLGIYSAWAKVRTRRYFYGNTRLDNASFDYRANPVAILKGRLIALGVFVIYSIGSQLNPLIGAAMGFILFLALPWLMVKSLAFNARNSAYRNVCFGFDGTMGDAVKAFILWPLAGMASLGILAPYSFYRQQRFIVENSRYGTSRFQFKATARPYYYVFIISFLILAAGGGISFGLTQMGGIQSAMIAPFAVWPVIFAYLSIFVYFNVKIINLRFNNALLSQHGFSATLHPGSYAMLVLTNTLATVLTLGLFHPWAQVRTARYKANRLQLLARGEIGSFAAAQEKEVGALGQEMGEIFDIEIAI